MVAEPARVGPQRAGYKWRDLGFVLVTWIFALEYSLFLVRDDFADKSIKLVAVLLILFQVRARWHAVEGREKTLLFIFVTLLVTALVPSVITGDPLTGIAQWMKISLMAMLLPLLLVDRDNPRKSELLLSWFVGLGVLFSIQALLAFIAVMGGLVETTEVIEVARMPDLLEVTLGPLGYANAVRILGENVYWLRPQGWFLEPSLFGSFLLLPAFVSLGRFLRDRRPGSLLAFVVVFAALVVTASFAAYLGFIVGLFFLILSRPLVRTSGALRYAYPVVILAAFLGVAVVLMTSSNKVSELGVAEMSEQQAMFAQVYARDSSSDSGNLLREVAKIDFYLTTIATNPLGIGLAQTAAESELVAPNGLLYWGVAGGLPALATLLVYFGCIFYGFCHPLLMSENPVNRCLAASLIGHAIHNFSYGNWLAPYFLIHLALVCMMTRQERRGAQQVVSRAGPGPETNAAVVP